MEPQSQFAPTWVRTEGIIIAAHLDPDEVHRYLLEQNLIACLEWYPTSPNYLSVVVAVCNGRVAILPAGASAPESGPELVEFVNTLATQFAAEVRINGAAADAIPAATVVPPLPTKDNRVLRAIEISPISEVLVPLVSAVEHIDVGVYALNDSRLAIYLEMAENPTRPDRGFGDVPTVSLQALACGDLRVALDNTGRGGADSWYDETAYVVYTWGMEYRMVCGNPAADEVMVERVTKLVGRAKDLYAIADAVPGASRNEVFQAALHADPQQGIAALARALGLSSLSAEFLVGEVTLAQIPDVQVHQSKGLTRALGSTVDMVIERPDSVSSVLWNMYCRLVTEKRWLIWLSGGVELVTGTLLVFMGWKGRGLRTGLRRTLGIIGGLVIWDSIYQVTIANVISHRRHTLLAGRQAVDSQLSESALETQK